MQRLRSIVIHNQSGAPTTTKVRRRDGAVVLSLATLPCPSDRRRDRDACGTHWVADLEGDILFLQPDDFVLETDPRTLITLAWA